MALVGVVGLGAPVGRAPGEHLRPPAGPLTPSPGTYLVPGPLLSIMVSHGGRGMESKARAFPKILY